MSERVNRKNYTREEALLEITMAELILDEMGAKKGMTLWGRIKSLKEKDSNNPYKLDDLPFDPGWGETK